MFNQVNAWCHNSVQCIMIGKGFVVVAVGDVVDDDDDDEDVATTGGCDCDWDALLFDDADDDWGVFGNGGGFIRFVAFAPFSIPAGNSVTFDSLKFDGNPFTSFDTLNGLTELLTW